MALEIERKFLVDVQKLGDLGTGERICQGYIPTQDKTAVRVRLIGDKAYLAIKGENQGAVRTEFEYPIPVADATAMLAELCRGPKIEKTRYQRSIGQYVWEIDVFSGANQGLIVAEVELTREDEHIQLPCWVGQEVTNDVRYYNTSLLDHPYSEW